MQAWPAGVARRVQVLAPRGESRLSLQPIGIVVRELVTLLDGLLVGCIDLLQSLSVECKFVVLMLEPVLQEGKSAETGIHDFGVSGAVERRVHRRLRGLNIWNAQASVVDDHQIGPALLGPTKEFARRSRVAIRVRVQDAAMAAGGGLEHSLHKIQVHVQRDRRDIDEFERRPCLEER